MHVHLLCIVLMLVYISMAYSENTGNAKMQHRETGFYNGLLLKQRTKVTNFITELISVDGKPASENQLFSVLKLLQQIRIPFTVQEQQVALDCMGFPPQMLVDTYTAWLKGLSKRTCSFSYLSLFEASNCPKDTGGCESIHRQALLPVHAKGYRDLVLTFLRRSEVNLTVIAQRIINEEQNRIFTKSIDLHQDTLLRAIMSACPWGDAELIVALVRAGHPSHYTDFHTRKMVSHIYSFLRQSRENQPFSTDRALFMILDAYLANPNETCISVFEKLRGARMYDARISIKHSNNTYLSSAKYQHNIMKKTLIDLSPSFREICSSLEVAIQRLTYKDNQGNAFVTLPRNLILSFRLEIMSYFILEFLSTNVKYTSCEEIDMMGDDGSSNIFHHCARLDTIEPIRNLISGCTNGITEHVLKQQGREIETISMSFRDMLANALTQSELIHQRTPVQLALHLHGQSSKFLKGLRALSSFFGEEDLTNAFANTDLMYDCNTVARVDCAKVVVQNVSIPNDYGQSKGPLVFNPPRMTLKKRTLKRKVWSDFGTCMADGSQLFEPLIQSVEILEYQGLPNVASLNELLSHGFPVIFRGALGAIEGMDPGVFELAHFLTDFSEVTIRIDKVPFGDFLSSSNKVATLVSVADFINSWETNASVQLFDYSFNGVSKCKTDYMSNLVHVLLC